MGTQHKRFSAWLHSRRGPREPDMEAALLAVADAYDAIEKNDVLGADQLRLIVEAASSSRALLWMNTVELLGKLSEQWPEAAEAVLEMSKSSKAHVRFNAICCLESGTPVSVVNMILKAGLTDKSSRVRWKAADRADKLERADLIPELTAALAAEKDLKARSAIEHHLLLLRDEYILKPDSDGNFEVTARTRGGGCTGRWVTAEELSAKGTKAIVAEMIARSNRLWGAR